MGEKVILAERRFSLLRAKKNRANEEEPATGEYIPRRKNNIKIGRERPVVGYLDPRMRKAFDDYLERHGLSVSECVRWLILDAVRTNKEPPNA